MYNLHYCFYTFRIYKLLLVFLVVFQLMRYLHRIGLDHHRIVGIAGDDAVQEPPHLGLVLFYLRLLPLLMQVREARKHLEI